MLLRKAREEKIIIYYSDFVIIELLKEYTREEINKILSLAEHTKKIKYGCEEVKIAKKLGKKKKNSFW